MPIDYKEYHPDWKAISLRIRNERAGNKCEWCGVRNREYVFRGTMFGEPVYQYADATIYHSDSGEYMGRDTGVVEQVGARDKATRIVLTVAHIDHDKTNNEDSNLAALCQRCHLNHDRKQHAENRRNGRNWKRDQTKLDL